MFRKFSVDNFQLKILKIVQKNFRFFFYKIIFLHEENNFWCFFLNLIYSSSAFEYIRSQLQTRRQSLEKSRTKKLYRSGTNPWYSRRPKIWQRLYASSWMKNDNSLTPLPKSSPNNIKYKLLFIVIEVKRLCCCFS